ncbi:hypothetical protein L9F63_026951, partial [Diploptera punctata]
ADTPLPGLNMVVHDQDVGDNARYTLKLRNVKNSAGIFTVHPTSAIGRTPVVIRVADIRGLDYDVADQSLREIIFDVVATVKGKEGIDTEVGSAQVVINLVDANDNSPTFPQSSYRLRVSESAESGSLISNITATDVDSNEYGSIIYSIKGFGAEKFYTQPMKEFMHICLDYETQKSYSLTFEARDGGGRISTASLFVEVEDVNDNAPVFEQREYSRTVREGATSFQPQLFVRATDIDGPNQGGGKIFYSIQSSNVDKDVFFVEPVSGEVKMNIPVNSSDTSRGQYEMVIRATDAGVPPLHDETRVLVRVGVPGNQRPIFRGNINVGKGPSGYATKVKENAQPGTEIVQVIATDPDGQDSLLNYFIAGGARDNFVINQSTGQIKVSPEARLDLESSGAHYDIIVHAVDSGTPIRETATTTVAVDITDVNNKPPVFSSNDASAFVRYVSERVPVAYVDDLDINNNETGYGTIRYSLSGESASLFVIDPISGIIAVAPNVSLDRERQSLLRFNVMAADTPQGGNEQRKASADVSIIDVLDVNDNAPSFTKNSYSAVVPENVAIGTDVITVTATDPDEEEGGEITYDLSNEERLMVYLVLIIPQDTLLPKGN